MIFYDPGAARVPSAAELAGRALARRFTQNGFNVVDLATARRLRRQASSLLRFESADNVAARLSLEQSADLVLIYRLTQAYTGTTGVLERGRSTILARTIVAATGGLLETSAETAVGVGATPEVASADATRRASEALGDLLVRRLDEWWAGRIRKGILHTVVLESNPRKQLEPSFTRCLSGLRKLVSLNLLACGGDLCEYKVWYRGTTARLRQALIKALKRQPEFDGIVTKSIRGNSLVFSVR